MFRLDDRSVLVTGAGDGIGAAARPFAAAGERVLVTDIDEQAAKATRHALATRPITARSTCATRPPRPRRRSRRRHSRGVDPVLMRTGPIPATRKLLERNGLTVGDIDLFEVNHAFSSAILAWERELKPDMDRVNVNGGAIVLGHPVGATGSRPVATISAELERRDAELSLVTMCCGGGVGTATSIRRLDR
ncbi:hypothetical protein [Amycolatopsis vastitatis]|uniref:hypothetical protein n=1 Tax=Amycolatopsis vastitatis TaxID=1905142 RepID=UPI00196AF0D5